MTWYPAFEAAAEAAAGRLGAEHLRVLADRLGAGWPEQAIAQALKDAETHGITGKSVTPFLLAALERITGGRSLAANMALIRNNAVTAARLAVAYAALTA